jgi:hypothetical protein
MEIRFKNMTKRIFQLSGLWKYGDIPPWALRIVDREECDAKDSREGKRLRAHITSEKW